MNIGPWIGRVGQDAELKYTQGGKAVASFSVAIGQGKDGEGNKRAPLWIKATLWEKKAEALAQYIKKGIMVAISGIPAVETWVSKTSGNAEGKIVVNVREFEFCGGGDKNADGESKSAAKKAKPQDETDSTFVDDSDIPF